MKATTRWASRGCAGAALGSSLSLLASTAQRPLLAKACSLSLCAFLFSLGALTSTAPLRPPNCSPLDRLARHRRVCARHRRACQLRDAAIQPEGRRGHKGAHRFEKASMRCPGWWHVVAVSLCCSLTLGALGANVQLLPLPARLRPPCRCPKQRSSGRWSGCTARLPSSSRPGAATASAVPWTERARRRRQRAAPQGCQRRWRCCRVWLGRAPRAVGRDALTPCLLRWRRWKLETPTVSARPPSCARASPVRLPSPPRGVGPLCRGD